METERKERVKKLLTTAVKLSELDSLEAKQRIFELCREVIFTLGPGKERKSGHELDNG